MLIFVYIPVFLRLMLRSEIFTIRAYEHILTDTISLLSKLTHVVYISMNALECRFSCKLLDTIKLFKCMPFW